MRVILAALFALGVLFGSVMVFDSVYGNNPPRWMGAVVPVVMLAAIAVAVILFNSPPPRAKSVEESIALLMEKGLVVEQQFKARRAFQCEEFEDEGSQYFIE